MSGIGTGTKPVTSEPNPSPVDVTTSDPAVCLFVVLESADVSVEERLLLIQGGDDTCRRCSQLSHTDAKSTDKNL
jgi:hypothetical protein